MAVAQAEDEYLGEHHVYRPHRAGLPPLGTYVRELWRRRRRSCGSSPGPS